MFILNATPDSFYTQSRIDEKAVCQTVEKALKDGADILDIGAYSSRPGADEVSPTEEWNRLFPILKIIVSQFPDVPISIDTFRGLIAKQALHEGAHIINDISGGTLDEAMFETIGKLNVPYIMMHMKGTPQNMQEFSSYSQLTREMLDFFNTQITLAKQAGLHQFAIDPGFGFAKTLEQNYQLMQQLDLFHVFQQPILVGVSRKSMIYKLLESTANDALNGTSVLHGIALQKGAHILRVHDVKEAVEVRKIIQQLNK